jgi:exodeoxyribonuclease VII large subunit
MPDTTVSHNQLSPYTVTELTQEIRSRLEEFTNVWVMGEISNLKYHTSGHVYLTIKDKENQLGAVIWRSTAKIIPFALKDGMEVLVSGELSVYQSKYQLTINTLEPRGIGALILAFENLKKKLAALGLFAPAHKKPLPALPRKICLVTSPTGAAVQDIINVILRRFPRITILVYPVRVQGEGSAKEVSEAIRTINQSPCFADVDVMIVGRGGGSLEDLWAFNEEVVAYAIFESRIPIISAVGHETDVTIADFVADRRALTPTEAGELVVPRLDQILKQLDERQKRLDLAMHNKVKFFRTYLSRLATHRAFARPLDRISHLRQRLHMVQHRLQTSVEKQIRQREMALTRLSSRLLAQEPSARLERYRQSVAALENRLEIAMDRRQDKEKSRVEQLWGRLETLSPLAVLRRGYSLTYNFQADQLLYDHSQVAPGDLIWVRLANSWILARVEKTGTR